MTHQLISHHLQQTKCTITADALATVAWGQLPLKFVLYRSPTPKQSLAPSKNCGWLRAWITVQRWAEGSWQRLWRAYCTLLTSLCDIAVTNDHIREDPCIEFLQITGEFIWDGQNWKFRSNRRSQSEHGVCRFLGQISAVCCNLSQHSLLVQMPSSFDRLINLNLNLGNRAMRPTGCS